MKNLIEKHYKKIIILVLGFMLVVSLLNDANDSTIFDETAHIGAAYSYLTQHEMRLNPEHPPLIKDLAGLPLLFLDLNFNVDQPFWTGELPRKWDEGQWLAGKNLLFNFGNNPNQIIFWSRLPIIILSLILGWFIFMWVKEETGIILGLFALVFYAFDPNILGHNHFVTTDLGIAAFFTFAFYFYLKFIKNPTWINVVLAGIFLGFLQLAKFSFLVGFPILALATIAYPLAIIPRSSKINIWKFRFKKLGEYIGKGILTLLISLLVVWGVYFINTYKMPKEIVSQAIDFNFSTNDPNIKTVYTNKTLHLLNSNSITRPLAIFGEGIGYVFRRVSGGNGAYFMQQVSSSAFLAYFPTVFILKEPLPSLFLMLLALTICFSLVGKSVFNKLSKSKLKELTLAPFIRHNISEITLLGFVVLYAYVSITGNLNIGFRHLFPILPFIYILTAKAIYKFSKELNRKSKRILTTITVVAILFLVSETVSAYPSYMSYFNQLAGGPKNGYHYVTDSNADWGQDFKRLTKFIDRYNWCPENSLDSLCNIYNPNYGQIDKIRISYFGGEDIKYYLNSQAIDWWDSKRPIEAGWYAVSVNSLMGSIYDATKKDNESFRWLKNKKPFYQVGTSILIYYVTPQEAELMNQLEK